MAHHRRKNRSLFPDKETIAKITARTTVEARWRSLDLRVTHEEDREDEDDRDKTRPGLNPGVEARCTCGEANLTAHFPLLDDANGNGRNGSRTDPNGSIPTVPKATVRAEVRRADGCNHPALVRAVASAIRSVAGRPDDDTNTIDKPFPSVQKSGGRRRNRTRAASRVDVRRHAAIHRRRPGQGARRGPRRVRRVARSAMGAQRGRRPAVRLLRRRRRRK